MAKNTKTKTNDVAHYATRLATASDVDTLENIMSEARADEAISYDDHKSLCDMFNERMNSVCSEEGDEMPKAKNSEASSAAAAVEALKAAIGETISEERVREIVEETLKQNPPAPSKVEHSFKIDFKEVSAAIPAKPHHCLEEVLEVIEEGLKNIFLTGPSGTGKTTLASHLAKGLGLPFGLLPMSGGTSESHLFGRLRPASDGSWVFKDAKLLNIFENGGVMLLDEFDATDPNVGVALNALLANGYYDHEEGHTIHRHEDCYIVVAANTIGRGATVEFAGRNALDGATLDRFEMAFVSVDYDNDVEAAIANEIMPEEAYEVCDFVWSIRKRLESEMMIGRWATTRLVERVAKARACGRSWSRIVQRYTATWTEDEKRKVFDGDKVISA